MAQPSMIVLTGASRGLGAAIAKQLLRDEPVMLTISRQPDPSLEAHAKRATLEQWAIDLGDVAQAAGRLEKWLQQHGAGGFSSAVLINNAGLIGRVGPVELANPTTLTAVLRVGLEAPMLLAAAFLKATRSWPIDKRILNISSGAGRRPIAGWAAYCAAKAGLDHASRAIALDEAQQAHPARIASVAPGVIDTDMQAELRAADAAGFPDKPRFEELKAGGGLASPEEAAARVIAYLRRADFGTQVVDDAR